MLSALVTGTFGSALTYWISTRYFGFSGLDCFFAVLASNCAGFFSLLLTLALERRPAIRRILMGNSFKTWFTLGVLYTGFMVALDPSLRDLRTLAVLWCPLVWSIGFMLVPWGKTQDWVIRWEHRRARNARFSSNQEFSRPERDVIRVEL
jgi:hypothetical protein